MPVEHSNHLNQPAPAQTGAGFFMSPPASKGSHPRIGTLVGFLFLAGLLLLSVNIVGIFTSLRAPFSEQFAGANEDRTILSEPELISIIESDVSNRAAYLKRVNTVVHQGILHTWIENGADPRRLRVPFTHNFILHAASYVKPAWFRNYEFTDWRRASERGIGLCSQQSIIVAEAFAEKGIPSEIVGLSGHVVLQAEADADTGQRWILDPDYGVIVPHGINRIELDPTLIAPFYRKAGYNESDIENLIRIYGAEGNRVFEGPGARKFYALIWEIERIAYGMIWALPLILMIPGAYFGISRLCRGENAANASRVGEIEPVQTIRG